MVFSKGNITMPMQAVVFLAGNNRSNTIEVNLTLPNGDQVSYTLPCISANQTVTALASQGLYLLLPFQQVQLNEQMNRISSKSDKQKHKIAKLLFSYHNDVKNELANLQKNDILNKEEVDILNETFINIENYLAEKDSHVKKEVTEMGDKDYIPWSDRLREEGREEGRELGHDEILIKQITTKLSKGKTLSVIAEEIEEDVTYVQTLITKYNLNK